MQDILKFIAEETKGKPHQSYKFCYDSFDAPSLDYSSDDYDRISMDRYAETNQSNIVVDLRGKAKLLESEKPLFTYFLDGSRRTYKIDDIEYNKKIYPIIAGQISVGCCRRENRTLAPQIIKPYSVISLPGIAYADGSRPELFFNNLTKKLNEQLQKIGRNIQFAKILHYKYGKLEQGEKYENKGIATIQDEMIESEKKIVAEMVEQKLLDSDNYLIKDGSLQYVNASTGDFRELSRIRNNYRYVVGVSKQFSPDLIKGKSKQSIAASIAELDLYHRTPAFMYTYPERFGDVKFAVWYVRIRDKKYSSTPFAGILKLEKMLITDDEDSNGLESGEVDLITANIINERNPVCYGSDDRWANHLYPVYLTERYVKSKYLSDIYFLNLF